MVGEGRRQLLDARALAARANASSAPGRTLRHRGPLESRLLIDRVVLRAAVVLGRAVASGPERGACGGVFSS